MFPMTNITITTTITTSTTTVAGAATDASDLHSGRDPADTHHEARLRGLRAGRGVEPQLEVDPPPDECRSLRRWHSGGYKVCLWYSVTAAVCR